MHETIAPSILYFGTPVVLISTENEDGSFNLAPMSSVFWLGWRCLLGLSARSKTTQNLLRTGECVLNLASTENADAVDRLALTTGSDPVPEAKLRRGYRHAADKFGLAGLTPIPSVTVTPPRAGECPVQLEATLAVAHGIADDHPDLRGMLVCIETQIRRVHADPAILKTGIEHHIDPDKWRPLIMSFQHLYGLGGKVRDSTLASIPEASYRTPEADLAIPAR